MGGMLEADNTHQRSPTMDALLPILILIGSLIALDLLALRSGADSRDHMGDDRARPMAG